jgi:hypothetical protein
MKEAQDGLRLRVVLKRLLADGQIVAVVGEGDNARLAREALKKRHGGGGGGGGVGRSRGGSA